MDSSSKGGFRNVSAVSPISGFNPLIEQTLRQASVETHNFLGDSGIKVSKVCLGTMTFGPVDTTFGDRPGQLNENEAHRLLDRYVELGGNFIDTGAFYPFFGTSAGESESIIGNWLTKRKDRKRIVLLTNVGLPTSFRDPNAIGLSRVNLINSLEDSLRRLKTNYIDVFCINGWDETTNIGDIMKTLNDFVRSGRVRHVGCCDLKGYQLQMCLDYAKIFNLEKFVTISCEYNLLSRGPDLEIVDICRNKKIGLLAYSPLKGGYLTDKIKPNMSKLPENSRIAAASRDYTNVAALAVPFEEMKNNELYKRVINTCHTIARKHGKTCAQVALRYLLHKDFISSVIIGCTSVFQLEENMGCLSFSLNQEDVEELDRVSLPPFPSPYNVDAFLKMTRSRLQLTNNLFTSNMGLTNVLSLPVHVMQQPNLVSIPPNVTSSFKSMNIAGVSSGHHHGVHGVSGVSPSRRQRSPTGRNVERDGSPNVDRQYSPNGRRETSPTGRKFSPSRRNVSPSGGRKYSPTRRDGSPSGRKFSPSRGETSPSERKVSPSRRVSSPSKRGGNNVANVGQRKNESKVENIQRGEKSSHKNVTHEQQQQQQQQPQSMASHIGTTLGNIAHSIGSPLSGGGLSGMSTSLLGPDGMPRKARD